jgi:hypothetical protein
MKVRQRSVPNDALSFDHKGYIASIYTNRQMITVSVAHKDGQERLHYSLTPEQFIELLMSKKQTPTP